LLRELEIKLGELNEDWHYSSLEKIFIEKRIYRDIEEQTTWEGVLKAIDDGLKPYKKKLRREVTQDDIIKLTEIRIKRISKYDAFKADEHIKGVEADIAEVKNNIANLNDYAIHYYENLLKKYGKGRERKTEIRPFENINANIVAIANTKLYVNKKEGFIGTSLKKDEFAFDCSDLDNIIVFRKDGKMLVSKVSEKNFVGKDIIHIAVFQKNDERTTYNMLYMDGKTGITYGKRFNVTGVTRDKEYDLTKGNAGSKIQYFSVNPNGEAEVLAITLSPGSKARTKVFDYYFEELEIKGRSAQGNQVTKYRVKSVRFKEKGRSTLSAPQVWYDDTIGRLNKDGNGMLLGRFDEKDRIIVFYKDGTYELTDFELTNRYDPDNVVLIEKFHRDKVITAIYYDARSKHFNVKRFLIESMTLKNKYSFIKEGEGNYLEMVTTQQEPLVIVRTGKKKTDIKEEIVPLHETVDVTGWKTVGSYLAGDDLKEISLIPRPEDGEEESGALKLF